MSLVETPLMHTLGRALDLTSTRQSLVSQNVANIDILHGDLTVEISTEYRVSQPAPFSQGQTATVPQTTLEAKEEKVKHIELSEGAIGATARDVVAILQAIKAAGALQAELEVI